MRNSFINCAQRLECEKCGDMEPWDWEHDKKGLYMCKCERKRTKSRIDEFLKLDLKTIRNTINIKKSQ